MPKSEKKIILTRKLKSYSFPVLQDYFNTQQKQIPQRINNLNKRKNVLIKWLIALLYRNANVGVHVYKMIDNIWNGGVKFNQKANKQRVKKLQHFTLITQSVCQK